MIFSSRLQKDKGGKKEVINEEDDESDLSVSAHESEYMEYEPDPHQSEFSKKL